MSPGTARARSHPAPAPSRTAEPPGRRLTALAEEALEATLSYSRACGWAGYSKHDGLNSPLLTGLFGRSRWSRLAAIQLVMRAPVNVRPWLGVPRTRNPKGLGLFAHALLDLWATRRREEDLAAARELLDWLLAHPACGFRGLAWGYPYPWQDVGFFAPRDYPNRVVTCWIGLAFVEALRLTGERRYREALPAIAAFLTEEPRVLCDEPDMKAYTYVPDPSVHWAVMDVPALCGAFLAEAGEALGRKEYVDEARRLVKWVVDKQTSYGAWFYTHPPEDSHITHDNYHTAIILDCLDRYRLAARDERFDAAYFRGLRFYQEHLFANNGAPRWRNDKEFPYDIHGAASSILCFTRAANRDPEFWQTARRTLAWTLQNMYDPRGFFYYQKSRWLVKKFCLLRWCNAWMCRALASAVRFSNTFIEEDDDDSVEV